VCDPTSLADVSEASAVIVVPDIDTYVGGLTSDATKPQTKGL